MSDFRAEVREWIAANLPDSIRTPMPEEEIPWGGRNASFPNPQSRQWLEAMIAKGWTAPTWPAAYGGGGLDAAQAMILQEELERANARPALFSFGLWMLGPVLLEYGTEEQKQRFLPPIVRGEIRWCQGYSEPGAGSDLASLRTRAEDKGGHWLVNGQKVWTTYADKADWIFALVRTDPAAPKHQGISFLLIDLRTPGVSVRPIELISGSSPFCETFFDDVKVPKENMVGPLNGGWTIAKKLLQYERQNVSAVGFGGDRSVRIEDLAKQAVGEVDGRIADGALRNRIARHNLYDRAVDLTTRRSQIDTDSGSVGALTSVVKYASAKANQARGELAVELLGLDGLGWSGGNFDPRDLAETRKWLRSKGNSIEGGTSEINLNVISKRVLGLPD
ncbi:acyl-CoA dehydrogenase [Sphingobium jiangsuense]|uniref:Alkylation response protein AidB-like acyl-CoA dehydrogenase n=1 Tax=Sphingobium jiangsuense TaxID=870476 RepID=A0A7W6BL96_9SPHN|nr:acyl-CoA dehydrogenase family protein [Sphingobium jiangsuense]MBB3925810.1 alkylation response protein AidB-like acyl-CoA dehydrogenase [Sphingobium jiangsuense]GLT02702.1 acyl-CoA dehydrogenase [Sphingobium jiangsuense]